ncbi:somatostatin receptor type 2-like [Oculina patagonica]
MEMTTTVIFCVVYFIEAILTLLGNIFTIFVFWKHRAELKRASYLLVSLAFADLLVAISITWTLSSIVKIAVQKIDELLAWTSPGFVILISWDLFCETSSLLNLLVISLERLYAVRSPFRHRTLTTRSYIYTLAFVWVFAGLMFLVHLAFLIDSRGDISILVTSPFFLVVLAIICAAYILICLQTRQTCPEAGRNERREQQNKKLTKTLLIVTVLSLICWLPAIILSFWISSSVIVDTLYTNNVIRIIKIFQYANSIVNPIVYAFRMPLFKSEIKKLFSKRNHDANSNQERITVCKQTRVGNNLQHFDTKL